MAACKAFHPLLSSFLHLHLSSVTVLVGAPQITLRRCFGYLFLHKALYIF